MLERFSRWLRGSFTCTECGEEFLTMSFGSGAAICPGCYRGEQPFIYYDEGFWLNRLITMLHGREAEATGRRPLREAIDPVLLGAVPVEAEPQGQ